MAVSPVGGVGGANLVSRLYQQQAAQMLSGTGQALEAGASTPAGRTAEAAATRGADFGQAVGDGLRSLEALDRTASTRAVQAATGELSDVHDYVIAATQMQTATELTTTVRNKALEAFAEIMRMPL